MLCSQLLQDASETEEASYLRSFADLVRSSDITDVPPSFMVDGALPSFSASSLASAPFSVRVQPPFTDPLPLPPPRPSPPSDFRPRGLRDLLDPLWYSRLESWVCDFGDWLCDLVDAAAVDPHSEALREVLSHRPEVFVVPQSRFVPAARGTIWDLRGGAPVPLDFTRPPPSHLNLSLVKQWQEDWPDYPDSEIFSHLLQGARFKAEPSPVIAGEKGFFTCHDSLPFAPWNTLPMGVAFRKLEPDRPRRTTDGGAPRKGRGSAAWLVDSDGCRVMPLNVLSRFSDDDIRRGTAEVFYQGVVPIDIVVGGSKHDLLLVASVRNHLLQLISDNSFCFAFLSPPCTSFSVAPGEWSSYLQRHNTLVIFSVEAIQRTHASGTPWVIENPASRNLPGNAWFWERFSSWASLFDLLDAEGISPNPKSLVPAYASTFAACSFGADLQKYTTLRMSVDCTPLRLLFDSRLCEHGLTAHTHHRAIGRDRHGNSWSASAAAYAPGVSSTLASGIAEIVGCHGQHPPLSSPCHSKPTLGSQPANHQPGDVRFVNISITLSGPNPRLANPFLLGDTARMSRFASLTGNEVYRDIDRLLEKHGHAVGYHLICGKRCAGKHCHGHVLSDLFFQIIE
ncbi:MAG: hypothetical protein SGPRY_013502, partial [Prymnesium sp.]